MSFTFFCVIELGVCVNLLVDLSFILAVCECVMLDMKCCNRCFWSLCIYYPYIKEMLCEYNSDDLMGRHPSVL